MVLAIVVVLKAFLGVLTIDLVYLRIYMEVVNMVGG